MRSFACIQPNSDVCATDDAVLHPRLLLRLYPCCSPSVFYGIRVAHPDHRQVYVLASDY